MTDNGTQPPKGHVKIARKAFTTDRWWTKPRKFSMWEAWIDMIQLAQWTAGRIVSTKYGTVELARGEFVLSIREMARRWGWTVQSVRSFTDSYEFSTRIQTRRVTPAGTVYLIVNYDKYQSAPRPDNTADHTENGKGPTQDQHRTNTRSKQVKQEKQVLLAASPDETRVAQHYLAAHPTRRAVDYRVIRRALALNYTAAELCEAIDGNAADDWHVSKKKHELSYVLRNAELIDSFRAKAAPVQLVDPVTGGLTAAGVAAYQSGR